MDPIVRSRSGVCRICTHPERTEIDRLFAAGAKHDTIIERYGLAPATWYRHVKHTREAGEALISAPPPKVLPQLLTTDLLGHLRLVSDDAQRLQAAAEGEGDVRAAVLCLRERARVFEILLRVAEARATRPGTPEQLERMSKRELLEQARQAHARLGVTIARLTAELDGETGGRAA